MTDNTPIDDDGLFKMEHIFYSTHHYDRCRELCMKDPVHTDGLLEVFQKQVQIIDFFLCVFIVFAFLCSVKAIHLN